MNRRRVIQTLGGLAVAPVLWSAVYAGGESKTTGQQQLTLSDEEWRRLLTPEQYDVLRKEGTETPGPLYGERRSAPAGGAGATPRGKG